MSKVSAKQRVDQLKQWISWIRSVSGKSAQAPKGESEGSNYQGKRPRFKKTR
jgi:hypothetical protein